MIKTYHNTQNIHAFSLIELLIVMTLISILSMIVYPTFTDQVQKLRRQDARTSLLNLQANIERCLSQHNNLSLCIEQLAQPINSEQGFYNINIDNMIDNTIDNHYILTALAQTSQILDTDCQEFTVDYLLQQKSYNNNQQETTSICW